MDDLIKYFTGEMELKDLQEMHNNILFLVLLRKADNLTNRFCQSDLNLNVSQIAHEVYSNL